jgi:hypothetical protein
LSFETVSEAVAALKQHGLLRECLENAATHSHQIVRKDFL